MDGHTGLCTNGHCGLYVNKNTQVDYCSDEMFGPGRTSTFQHKPHTRQFRKRVSGEEAFAGDESCRQTYVGSTKMSSPECGDRSRPMESRNENFWSAVLRTSRINIQRRDFNNNTKNRKRKKDKQQNKIVIPCGESLHSHECTMKPRKRVYELPPLKGAPCEVAQRKVNQVMVGAYCSNIKTPMENKNLESRLTYLDKSEYRPCFRPPSKKTQQARSCTSSILSVKLPKLVENEDKSREYEEKMVKSLFKLPSIIGTTCVLDTPAKQNQSTIGPEVEEGSGSTSCSLGNVKLPPIGPCVKDDSNPKRKKKNRG